GGSELLHRIPPLARAHLDERQVQVAGGVVVLARLQRAEAGLNRGDSFDHRERRARGEVDAVALVGAGGAYLLGQDRVRVGAAVAERLSAGAPVVVETREKGRWVTCHRASSEPHKTSEGACGNHRLGLRDTPLEAISAAG